MTPLHFKKSLISAAAILVLTVQPVMAEDPLQEDEDETLAAVQTADAAATGTLIARIPMEDDDGDDDVTAFDDDPDEYDLDGDDGDDDY